MSASRGMLTQAEAKRVLDRVMLLAGRAKATALAALDSNIGGNARFAVNEITSSSELETRRLQITAYQGKRSASVQTNQLDDRSIEHALATAVRLAKLAPEDPESMPPLGKQAHATVRGALDQPTADHSPAARAAAIAAALAAADRAKVQLAGFYEHEVTARALASTEGLSAFHAWTAASLSCTARTVDGTGSGWASAEGHRVADLDAAGVARRAVDKAVASAKPTKLDPGRYTVILEPAAVAGLLAPLCFALDARRSDEGRSFFSRPGGGTRVGDKLFGEGITVRSDPTDVALRVSPFDGEGLPRKAETWIDRGVVRALSYDRYWAHKNGKSHNGAPTGWTLDGGTASREQLLDGVKRGVLVTRFWYIRSLDPQTILMTGLTRDGTFLVENGKITRPLVNFRFNESPVQMLARADARSAAVVVEGMRVPALRTHDFQFSSVSEAV